MELTFFIVFLITIIIGIAWFKHRADENSKILLEEEINKEIQILEHEAISIDPHKFLTLNKDLKNRKKSRLYSQGLNFEGIYVLHNITKDKHYVGQSVNVIKRVGMHFGGKKSGNAQVYQDFKKGHEWNIKLIDMKTTNYNNLNDLEKYAIKLYKGYDKGYNKTRGNKS